MFRNVQLGELFLCFEKSQSEDQIHAALKSALEYVDFDYYALCLTTPWPLTRKKSYVLTNFPVAWENRRNEARHVSTNETRYVYTDPVIYRPQQHPAPIMWSDALFTGIPTLWRGIQSQDLLHGCSLQVTAVHGISGEMYMGRSISELTTETLAEYETAIRLIADATIRAVIRIMLPKIAPGVEIVLTDREREILKWMADGKTASEIAAILRISVYTVNFHVKNTIVKLETTNKTAAVARAAMLGLIA